MNKLLLLPLLLVALVVSPTSTLGQGTDGGGIGIGSGTCSSDTDCDTTTQVCTIFTGIASGTCTNRGQLFSRCDAQAPCESTSFLKLECLEGYCLPVEGSTATPNIPPGGTCAVLSNTETCVENYFCNPLSLKCESATISSCTTGGGECAAGQICVPIPADQGGDGTNGACITVGGGGSDQCNPACGEQEQCIGGQCIGLGNGTPGELNGPCLADNSCTNTMAVCFSGVCSLPEDTTIGQPGEMGGSCVEGACNGDNRCINNFCLPPEGSPGLGGSPGELGGPCLEGACSSSSQAVCLAGFCVPQDVGQPSTSPGQIGGPCLEDGSCTSIGATCSAEGICVASGGGGGGGLNPGELGGACMEDGTCNTGLECSAEGTCAEASSGGGGGGSADGPCECLCNGIPVAGFKYSVSCATCPTMCRSSMGSFCTTLGFGVVDLDGSNRGIIGNRCTGDGGGAAAGDLGGACLPDGTCNAGGVCGDEQICVPESGNTDASTGTTDPTPAVCSLANPCPEGQRCNAASQCVPLSVAGSACTATAECQTGLTCTDSICKSPTGTTPPPKDGVVCACKCNGAVVTALDLLNLRFDQCADCTRACGLGLNLVCTDGGIGVVTGDANRGDVLAQCTDSSGQVTENKPDPSLVPGNTGAAAPAIAAAINAPIMATLTCAAVVALLRV